MPKLSRSARRLLGRTLLAATTLTASSGAVLAVGARPAAADQASDAAVMANDVNAIRAWFHLPGLLIDPALSAYAAAHSAQMAPAAEIFHSASLLEVGAVVPGWSQVGENVGMGPSLTAVDDALAHSIPHLRNILGAYDVMGVGVTRSGGAVYVTEEFARVPL